VYFRNRRATRRCLEGQNLDAYEDYILRRTAEIHNTVAAFKLARLDYEQRFSREILPNTQPLVRSVILAFRQEGGLSAEEYRSEESDFATSELNEIAGHIACSLELFEKGINGVVGLPRHVLLRD
jgi:hypothetical protein